MPTAREHGDIIVQLLTNGDIGGAQWYYMHLPSPSMGWVALYVRDRLPPGARWQWASFLALLARGFPMSEEPKADPNPCADTSCLNR